MAPDWNNVFSSGLLPTPSSVWDWAVATFIDQNWNTWCQCIGGQLGCGSQTLNFSGGAHGNLLPAWGTVYDIPDSPTTITIPWSATVSQAGTSASHAQLQLQNSTGGQVALLDMGTFSGTSGSGSYSTAALQGAYAAARTYSVRSYPLGGLTGIDWTSTLTGTATFTGCSSPVTGYSPPPVGTPPTGIPNPPALPTGCTLDQVCAKITYVEQQLDAIARLLNKTPTTLRGYTETNTHANLTGNGSFALLSTTIAVKIVLTTIPAHVADVLGDPTRYLDVGYFTPAGVEGAYATWALNFQTQVFSCPPLTNSIHYSVPTDCRASVIELAPVT